MALVCQSAFSQTGCKPPFDLRPLQPNDSTISLNWSQWLPNDLSLSYDAELREAGTLTWTPAEFPYGHEHEYCNYTKVTNGKCYEWRVRTICKSHDGGTDTTEWSITSYCAKPALKPCESPIGISTKIKNDTASLSWKTIPNSGFTYQVEIREYKTPTWSRLSSAYTSDFEHSTDTIVALDNCYEWRVRAICPSSSSIPDTSDWAGIMLNTGTSECPTTLPCQTPGELRNEMANDSTASLSWSLLLTGNGGSYYDAEYRELPLTEWAKAFFPYGNDHELAFIKNAKRSVCYEWRVRTICFSNSKSDSSEWVYKTLNTGAALCPNSPPPATVTVNPNFSFMIDPCSPRRVSFSNTTTVSGTSLKSIEWDLGDNTKASTNELEHVYQKPGTYQVTLTVMDQGGKTYQKASTLTVRDLHRFANAGSDLTLCSADTVSLLASGGESYSWSPCINLSDCRIANPKVHPGTTKDYIVTVTNKDGCTDHDTISVRYIDLALKLHVPNAFTPNNDGTNDLFRPLISLPRNANAECKLFNRFGNMVFSADNTTTGWNGNYKGQPQPSGNYTYMITLKAENTCPAKLYKGTVLLIR